MSKLPDPLPTTDVARFVADLAREQGVVAVRTRLDEFAEKVTELSGDEVRLDKTELTLVMLAQKASSPPAWIGGHGTEPNEQNTQQSPGFGCKTVWHLSHS